MLSTTFGILIMAAVAQAAHPSLTSRKAPELVPGTTDQGSDLSAVDSRALPEERRGNPTGTFGDHTGSWSSFTDGSGTYVTSKDVYRYSSGDKCWTDLFYVSSFMTTDDWVRNGEIDCSTTSECERGVQEGVQTCATWSLEESFSAEIDLIEDFLSVGTSTTYSFGGSQCKDITTSSDCHWDDQGCHAVWTSNNVKVNRGYIRRRCDFHDGKGDQTVWSYDLDVNEQASGLNLGCRAGCSDTSYPSS